MTGGKHIDGKPYFTLSYANGDTYNDYNTASILNPGEATRVNPENIIESMDGDYLNLGYPAGTPGIVSTHAGDDVAIFAKGPFAQMFHTVHEQTHIANVMMYASCLGPYSNEERCVGGKF